MPTTVHSHNLIVQNFTRRPDGLVAVHATITRAGVYFNIPFSTRAFPPNDSVGFPMTPAVADPQHTKDPIVAAAAGMPIVFVWNAPADGYPSVNLNGWKLGLAYLDLYCCEEDPTPPPDDEPDDAPPNTPVPGQPVPPPPAPPPTTQPPVPPTTSPSWPGQPTPVPNTDGFQFEPFVPPILNPTDFVQSGPYAPTGPQFGGGYSAVPGGVFVGPGGAYFDQNGNPIVGYDPNVVAPDLWEVRRVPFINPAPAAPVQSGNIPVTLQGQVAPPAPPEAGTQQAQAIVEPHQGVQYATSQASLSDLYGAPSDNGTLSVTAQLFPDEAPADAKPIFLYSIFNNTPQAIEGLSYSVYAVDANGQQYQVAGQVALPSLPAYAPNGGTLCVSWLGFVTGAVTLFITINSATGQVILSFQVPGVILPPGTLPPPPQASPNELPASITQYAGFPATITSVFQGSRNAVGDDDFYKFVAGSSRVSIVVVATPDAIATGFLPVLKIFNTTDLDTPLVSYEQRFPVAEPDRSKHSIGWKDAQSLPVLEEGETYLLQVLHRYPFWSRRWGFKVYLTDTVPACVPSFSVSGGALAGSLTSAYGRQSLKILNDRTGGVLFVATSPYGAVDSVVTRARPFGDTLTVATGDRLKIYRPGIGVRYRNDDLLTTVTV